MTTPDSSVRLRAAVDAVATDRHETAFQLLDLHQVTAQRATINAESRARADELAASLDVVIAQIDPPSSAPADDARRSSDQLSSSREEPRRW